MYKLQFNLKLKNKITFSFTLRFLGKKSKLQIWGGGVRNNNYLHPRPWETQLVIHLELSRSTTAASLGFLPLLFFFSLVCFLVCLLVPFLFIPVLVKHLSTCLTTALSRILRDITKRSKSRIDGDWRCSN